MPGGGTACRRSAVLEPMWAPVLAIAFGASCGALLRWQLGVRLNGLFPAIPLGTLAANLLGGYLVGLAIASLPRRRTCRPAGGCSSLPASVAA